MATVFSDGFGGAQSFSGLSNATNSMETFYGGGVVGASNRVTLASTASSTVLDLSGGSYPVGWFVINSFTSASGATTSMGRAMYFVSYATGGSPYIETIVSVSGSIAASITGNSIQVTNNGSVTRTIQWIYFPYQ